jgi:The GLUG motif
MKKILITWAVSVFLAIGLIGSQVHADGFSGSGAGIEPDPYVITTCAQLQEMDTDLNAYYVLDNDIDCSQTNPEDAFNESGQWTDGKGFDPIGNVALNGGNIYSGFNYESFTGTLDGQNHKITNLYINRGVDANDVNGYYIGLFSTISSGAEVKNLGIEDVDITGSGNNVGALAGGLSGTATNVHSTGSVHGDGRVGGLVGVHVDSNSFPNSSPLVYSWNGEKYVYTDDVGSILPKELDGVDVASIDSKDVTPKDGKYSFKIAEEYNEIVYYDELSLMTFDHQPGYSVVEPIDRTAGVSELRTVNDTPTNPLISCTDDTGSDCLDNLKSYDDKWSYTNTNGFYDKKNLNKYWILDFGDLSNATDTELVFRGARDYAASAKYPGNSVRSVQVKDANGNWVTVYNKNQIGSDGSPRLRTLDMTGKFLTNDYHVKVAFDTFNANYFAVDTSPQVPFTSHTYHPDSANLGFNGFTAIDHTYFFNHDYSKISPLPDSIFKNQYGNFTKYGDVNTLLTSPDDHFVIMKSGDQLSVEFPYEAVPEGMERSFMLYNDVFYKHATNDNLGVVGQSAGYLPYHGMTSYSANMTPYPQTPENIEYMNTWNTRNYPGPFPDAMRSGGSTIIDSYSSVNVTGNWNVGGLVGNNLKEIRRSYATGNVLGSNEVGGLVGENDNGGTIGWIHDSYARGNVGGPDGYYYIGGLVGMNYGTIERSYSTGEVTGNISGNEKGFIGYQSGDVLDSFWDTETSGKSIDDGATGKTTLEMKDVATFTNLDTEGLLNAWDFIHNPNNDIGEDDIWKINTELNDGYPILVWQNPVDSSTEAPILSAPLTSHSYINSDPLTVSFTLPEDIFAGSIILTFTPSEGDPIVIHLRDAMSNQLNTFSLNLSNVSSAEEVISTSAEKIPVGTYTVTLAYQDSSANPAASVSVSNVSITAPEHVRRTNGSGRSSGLSTNTPTVINTPTITKTDFSTSTPDLCLSNLYLTKVIKLGADNNPDDVKLLENFLKTYEGQNILVDGIYSQSDFDVVVKWQEKYAKDILAPWGNTKGTGYVFTTSLKKIKEIVDKECKPSSSERTNSVPQTTTTSTPTPNTNPITSITSNTNSEIQKVIKNLEFGMKDSDVVILQNFLVSQNKGPAALALKNNGVTQYFGNLTKAALAEWQKANTITPALGFFGPMTRGKIKELGL